MAFWKKRKGREASLRRQLVWVFKKEYAFIWGGSFAVQASFWHAEKRLVSELQAFL